MSTAQQHSSRLPDQNEAAPAHIDLVPVDPHRLFAHWNLPPRDLAQLREMAGDHAADHHLTLRVFRLSDGDASLSDAVAVEDFPVGAPTSDGYFSLTQPGGNVAGVLGIKNSENRFTPAVTSGRVALPEAPQSAAMAEVPESVTSPDAPEELLPATVDGAEITPTAEGAERAPVVLDEDSVIAAAGRMKMLPKQLRIAPSASSTTAEQHSPERQGLWQTATSSDTTANRVPSSAESGSSYRLASQMGGGVSGAPMQMRATLAITGVLAPGQKLRVGDQQISAGPGGKISFSHQLESTEAIWPLLLHVLLHQPTRSMPSLELLSDLPDSAALLSLHASIDIEGEIHDPAYRSRLPREVNVDQAGRFRIVRPLPAGALLLPHLVLVAKGEE